ncbi:MAG: T9SS type A sorting domain-containing protein [Ignavibacteria bacterium]|nr:T9SS type A sorting domain-containing protein [Ignavibacteria bacterium]
MKIILFFVVFSSFSVLSTWDSYSQTITWQKVLNNNYGDIQKIQQTRDQGYVAVGNERISNQNKIYLVKLDKFGNVLWARIIGIGENQGNWVEQTIDGGYIIGGATDTNSFDSYAYLQKTDSAGSMQWQKLFHNSDLDQCYCVRQTPDGGYILSCRTTPVMGNVIWYIKTDSTGNLQWQKIYSNSLSVLMREIEILNDGYIAVGTMGIAANADMYVMRLNLSGDTIWTKHYGGAESDGGRSIDLISNCGFVLAGSSKSFNLNNKVQSYIVRIDNSGNIIWQNTYSNNGDEGCFSIRFKPGTGYLLAGDSDSLNNYNFLGKVRLIDTNGKRLYENSFTGSDDGSLFFSGGLCNDGGFILGGMTTFTGGFPKMYIVKTDSLLHSSPIGIINISNQTPKSFKLYQNFPNPFNPSTNINFEILHRTKARIVIYDLLGKVIDIYAFENLNPGKYQINWNAIKYSSGIYFYTLIAQNYNETRKMLLLK